MSKAGDYMLWNELFGKEHEPSEEQIAEFVDSPLWGDLTHYLQQTYRVKPKSSYSGCAMDGGIWKGWNVKYKKGGKSLCTLYPKQGYFLSLITIAEKDAAEADFLISHCCEYVQDLYNRAEFGKNYGKMLGLEVTSEEILRDMKELISLRVNNK
jgi:AraC family transcriptional regulator